MIFYIFLCSLILRSVRLAYNQGEREKRKCSFLKATDAKLILLAVFARVRSPIGEEQAMRVRANDLRRGPVETARTLAVQRTTTAIARGRKL